MKRLYLCTFLTNVDIAAVATLFDVHERNYAKSFQINPRLPYGCSKLP
jgi:hypothetical protein